MTGKVELRTLAKFFAVLLAAFGLSGFYTVPNTLLESGERVPIAGSYDCTMVAPGLALGTKMTTTMYEFSEGGLFSKNYTYYQAEHERGSSSTKGTTFRFMKISDNLYLAQWYAKEDGKFARIMMFIDLSIEGKVIFLWGDVVSKRPYIEELAAKSGVRLDFPERGLSISKNNLFGEKSAVLNFLKRHDKSLMLGVLVCQKTAAAPSPAADPAGDVFAGKWNSDTIYEISEKSGEIIVSSKFITKEIPHSVDGNRLVGKGSASKTTLSLTSSNTISFQVEGKEISKWERIEAPQSNSNNAFIGKWRSRVYSDMRRVDNDFFAITMEPRSDAITHWRLVNGALVNYDGKTLRYDKARDVLLYDMQVGDKTVTKELTRAK